MKFYKQMFLIPALIICLFIVSNNAFAKSRYTCLVCDEIITGSHLVLNDQHVHKSCFVCIKCKKKISGGFNQEGRDLYHPDCYKEVKGIVCSYCGKVLKKEWFEKDGGKFHEVCYRDNIQTRCDICGKLIHGDYKKDDDGSYHVNCFKSHKLAKCVICTLPIENGGIIDVWGNDSHGDHNGIVPDLCGSCGRVVSKASSDGGFVLSDKRIVCGKCDKTAVVDQAMVESVSGDIKRVLGKVGIFIPKNVPVHLVDTKQLSKVAAEIYTEKTKGFTNTVTKSLAGKRIFITHKVYVLSNLPIIEFKGVLIHEYLHVWLNEKGIKMPLAEMEGFCNLGYMLSNSYSKGVLARILQKNLDGNPDPVYGEGYRTMKRRLSQSGWKQLIKEIRQMAY